MKLIQTYLWLIVVSMYLSSLLAHFVLFKKIGYMLRVIFTTLGSALFTKVVLLVVLPEHASGIDSEINRLIIILAMFNMVVVFLLHVYIMIVDAEFPSKRKA